MSVFYNKILKINATAVDLDYELYEFNDDFGDSKLHTALENYSKRPNRYKIIGVFDCDEAYGKKIHTGRGIKEYGNNVYGITIPIPDFRDYHEGISVEFLYPDEQLKKADNNNRRIFLTSEFNNYGRLQNDTDISVTNINDVKNYLAHSKEKIQDSGVFNKDGNSLALSKNDFADNVLNANNNFTDMDFNGFKTLFERLQDVINR
ncbi:hypothetical protein FACS1894199_16990 [Bacteroidia bacterium]|nr:hypothetical protein FACS1894199_16990 [Bacteroidia bacterium]